MRAHQQILSILVLTALVACGDAESNDAEATPEPSQGTSVEVPELSMGELLGLDRDRINMTLPWSQGPIARDPAPSAAAPTLTSMDAVSSSAFDRVVLEFTDDAPFPGYRIGWNLELPEGCDAEAAAESDDRLLAVLTPVSARDEGGQASVNAEVETGLPWLQAVRRICETEGAVVLELDVSERTEVRILQLGQPNRLAIDVRAPAG